MSQEVLQKKIVELSEADNFGQARNEWAVEQVYSLDPDEELETCLCSYHPIKHICVIVNRNNGNNAIVGNSCVSRFLGATSSAILKTLARIIQNPSRSLNTQALDLLLERGVISPSDYEASLRSTRKRKLSPELRELRTRVNSLAIAFFARRNRDVAPLPQP